MWVAGVAALLAMAPGAAPVRLAVPVIAQAPERCGPAALEMVFRFYGAGPVALAEADSAYDPVLHGSLITELAARARRAGFAAEVATLDSDSLVALLGAGVPAIVLLQSGIGPVARAHYAVVTGWDPARGHFTIHDGAERPHEIGRGVLERRWRGGDFRALVVRRTP
jgi:ABC-type bacteriocin/lantibiotic exporter with double-glycine peptidase domain